MTCRHSPQRRPARNCRNLLLEAGFRQVRVEVGAALFTGETALPLLTRLAGTALAAGAISDAEAEAWAAEQHRRAAADRAFVAAPVITTAATRP